MEDEQSNEANSARAKKRNSPGRKNDANKKKKRKKKRTHRARRVMTSQEAAHFFPRALLPLVKSGFFDTKDLGRFLLRTNKAMTVASLAQDEDTVWKCLCASYWGTKKAHSLLEGLAPMSPRTCFYQLAVMEDTYIFEGPRPSQYMPQDYVFIVSMKDSDTGKPMLCHTIPGQDISKFFDGGTATIMLEDPLWEKELDHVGTTWSIVERGEFFVGSEVPASYTNLTWDGALHILRRPDQRMERFRVKQEWEDRVEIYLNEQGYEKCNVLPEPNLMHRHSINVSSHYGKAFFKYYGCDTNYGNCGHTFDIGFDLKWRKSGNNRVGICGFDFFSSICQMNEELSLPEYQPFSKVMEGKDVTVAHFLEAMM